MVKSSCSKSLSLIRMALGSAGTSFRKLKSTKSSSSSSCAIPREFAGSRYTSKCSQPLSPLFCAGNAEHTTPSHKQALASTTRSNPPTMSQRGCGGRSAVERSLFLGISWFNRWTTRMAARQGSMSHTSGIRGRSTTCSSQANIQQ